MTIATRCGKGLSIDVQKITDRALLIDLPEKEAILQVANELLNANIAERQKVVDFVVKKYNAKKPKQESAKKATVTEPSQDNERFSAGRKLSKSERNQVMNTLVDVYKLKGAEKETRINNNGDEYNVYIYQPELFEKSDITGKPIRFYVTMPDGKIAHPTELFPDVTQSKIDAIFAEQQYKNEIEQKTKDKLLSSGQDTVEKANQLFKKGHYSEINPENYGNWVDMSVLMEKDGEYIRVAYEPYADILLENGWIVRHVNQNASSKYHELFNERKEIQAKKKDGNSNISTSNKPNSNSFNNGNRLAYLFESFKQPTGFKKGTESQLEGQDNAELIRNVQNNWADVLMDHAFEQDKENGIKGRVTQTILMNGC